MTATSPTRLSSCRPGLLVLAVCALLPTTVLGQRNAPVPDPDPELERKTFVLPEGFEVNLFAADPLLAKPIQINFDPAGRLWVACSEAYPQLKPGQQQNDKIIVLEDTRGVGKADKVTVFADGLLIPTGLAPGDGGCYVVDSTDLLHLSKPGPDGKATKRTVVLSGFGTEDTHHMVHTLRWGPDGMLYFNQSVYIHSHLETPYGVRHLNAGGVWQFRPETRRLEVFAHGLWNGWGTAFDRWGTTFLTDGAGGEGINYCPPGAWFAAAQNPPRILPGLNPGSPKDCGLEILSGRHLPDDWQGNFITNDFRGHRVCRYIVTPEGAGFVSREQKELIRSNHPAFRPIDVKMGPDGAIYIADWYNPIIQHGEVDFRDPRRDVTHGRIWRITVKGRPLVPRPQLVDAPVTDLLEALKAPEEFTRRQARRVLQERGVKHVLPALKEWTSKLDPADEPTLLEALWTFQALDVVEPKLLATLLKAIEHRVRAAAVRVGSMWSDRLPDALALLGPAADDEAPLVRLEAVRALVRIPNVHAVERALVAVDRPVDRFLDYALYLTVSETQGLWLPAVQQGTFDYANKGKRLLFAFKVVNNPAIVSPLLQALRKGHMPPESEAEALSLVASLGNPTDLSQMLDRALTPDATPELRATVLTALEQAVRKRNVQPAGDLQRIAPLLRSEAPPVRAATARLIGLWKLETVRPELVALAGNGNTPEGVRLAALDGLVAALGGPLSRDALGRFVDNPRETPTRRRQALVALANLDAPESARRAVAVLALTTDGAGSEDVLEVFLQRKDGPELLTKALAGKKLPPDAAKVVTRRLRSAGRDLTALIDAVAKAGGLTAGPRRWTQKEKDDLLADLAKLGDPVRGEAIYRRKESACQNCHALGGAGGRVGPELSSIGSSAPLDYLLDSLLEPNKAIKEGYHSSRISTTDGRIFVGIKVKTTDTEIVLRTAEDKEITIARRKIEEDVLAPSLMPEGLVDPLTRAEMIDLVRFLSELGKVGPYAPSTARLARRWEVLEPTKEAWTTLYTKGFGAVTTDPALTWVPAYATALGQIPLADVPVLEMKQMTVPDKLPLSFARTQIEVTTPGPVQLRLNGLAGLELWSDGTPVSLQQATALKLEAGMHTLTFRIDRSVRKDGLKVELEDVPGSPARARLVGGK